MNARNVRTRTVAALAGAALVMGGAVVTAGPASAEPRPQVGKACPKKDTDFGIYVKQYNLIREAWNSCTYDVYKWRGIERGVHYTVKYIKGGGVLR